MSYRMKSANSVDPVRSLKVAKDIKFVTKELGISRRKISQKSGISETNIGTLLNGSRPMGGRALDKLEPVVNAYLKVLEYSKTFEVLK